MCLLEGAHYIIINLFILLLSSVSSSFFIPTHMEPGKLVFISYFKIVQFSTFG